MGVRFTATIGQGGYYDRVLVKVIEKRLQGQTSAIVDRMFNEYGGDIMSTFAKRMFIFLRDVNTKMRGYPVYSGGYMAEKFGGLFRSPKIQAMVGDLMKIEPYGAMLEHGRRAKDSERAAAIEMGKHRSKAQFFIRRQKTGISGAQLMLAYKIPPANAMALKYAESVEYTGWGKTTPPYKMEYLLTDFKWNVYNKEFMEEQFRPILRRVTKSW